MDRLIAFVSIAQSIYSRWIFRRLLYGMIAIATLTIITSMMVSAMLIGLFYATYQSLIHSGVEPHTATLSVTALVTAVALLFMFTTLIFLRRLREMPRKLLLKKVPKVSHASDVMDAFLEGLLDMPVK